MASATARSWQRSMMPAVRRSASAHSAETDFTGENVASNPATAAWTGRDCRLMNPASSRASSGSRPKRALKCSRPTSVRTRARTSGSTGAPSVRPWARFHSVSRRATSMRKSLRPG